MLLICEQCNENGNKWFLRYSVSVLFLLTFMVMLMTCRLAQMKVKFFLLFDE